MDGSRCPTLEKLYCSSRPYIGPLSAQGTIIWTILHTFFLQLIVFWFNLLEIWFGPRSQMIVRVHSHFNLTPWVRIGAQGLDKEPVPCVENSNRWLINYKAKISWVSIFGEIAIFLLQLIRIVPLVAIGVKEAPKVPFFKQFYRVDSCPLKNLKKCFIWNYIFCHESPLKFSKIKIEKSHLSRLARFTNFKIKKQLGKNKGKKSKHCMFEVIFSVLFSNFYFELQTFMYYIYLFIV